MESREWKHLTQLAVVSVVICLASLDQMAFAKWKPLGAGLGTTGNDVYALTVYDGMLIAGGNFQSAGGVDANRIAAWDGESWHPLGDGTNSAVYALTVYEGQLIAGGAFVTAGGQSTNRIARWDGQTWQPLGNGIADCNCCSGNDAHVQALAVYNSELIAGGCFTMAGNQNANHIARWDGTSWSAIGDDIGFGNGTNQCLALAVYNDELIAGGKFHDVGGQENNYIIRWNGASWQPLASPDEINAPVLALTVHNGELIAAGTFAPPGFNGLARWNGTSWSGMGNVFRGLNTVASFDGDVIAGFDGSFEDGYGNIFNRIARWNGKAWQTMHTGMNLPVLSLSAFGDQLIAGGIFTFASNEPASRIARWAPCPGDATEDDVVNVTDLLLVITFWGDPGALNGIADLNDDGLVDVTDLLIVINGWGPCP